MQKTYILSTIMSLLAFAMSAQIKQVTDVNTTEDSGIGSPFLYNGAIYFEADAGVAAQDELYKLNADGTVTLVKDINVDAEDTTPTSDPSNFTEYKGLLYFKANDGDNTEHDIELWVTDGTEANTHMVYDIQTGVKKGSNPQNFFVFNNKMYFQANDGSSTEWWSYDAISDPVKATTLRSSGFATVNYPIIDEVNNRVFFQYNNDNNKTTLCILKADGSTEPIVINDTGHSYVGSQAILFDGKLYFQGDNGTDGDELWVSDGTTAGTKMIKDINTAAAANSDPESFTIMNNKLYFVADAGTGAQLWVTDGTTDGTVMVAETIAAGDGKLDNLLVYNNKIYFSATDETNGIELWVFDGTTASMVKDINVGGDSKPAGLIVVGDYLFFTADNGTATTLWVSDGTTENTVEVASVFETSVNPTDVSSTEYVVDGTKLYFTGDDAQGDDLFMVDAADISFEVETPQIKQVTDVNTTGDSGIGSPFLYNGAIYFEADAGDAAQDELYKLNADGTVTLVKDINVDAEDTTPTSDPSNFTEYKGLLYFKANDGDNTEHDIELWVTDGTEANTHMVYDIQTGVKKGSNPQNFFVFNNKMYFQANDGSSTEWWSYDAISDPVKATTLRSSGFATVNYPIIDEVNNRVFFQYNNDNNKTTLCILKADGSTEPIVINDTGHSYVGSQAILFDGKLYFQGDNGTDGDELWVSDGTTAGTKMIKDINTAAAANSDPESFTIMNNKLYFVADAGTGAQLWVTDGTTEGTVMVAETIAAGDGKLDNLLVYNNKIYFSATDETNGIELWVFDGTTASMVKDINVGGDSKPAGLIVVGDYLFFTADNGTATTLWVSDGTTENTVEVASVFETSVNPTDVSSTEYVVDGTKLYFTGDDAQGDDLFMVDAASIVLNGNGHDAVSNTNAKHFTVYPNPTEGTIFVEGAAQSASYKVFDLNARIISFGKINSQAIQLNVASGVYFLQIEEGTSTTVQTIIVK